VPLLAISHAGSLHPQQPARGLAKSEMSACQCNSHSRAVLFPGQGGNKSTQTCRLGLTALLGGCGSPHAFAPLTYRSTRPLGTNMALWALCAPLRGREVRGTLHRLTRAHAGGCLGSPPRIQAGCLSLYIYIISEKQHSWVGGSGARRSRQPTSSKLSTDVPEGVHQGQRWLRSKIHGLEPRHMEKESRSRSLGRADCISFLLRPEILPNQGLSGRGRKVFLMIQELARSTEVGSRTADRFWGACQSAGQPIGLHFDRRNVLFAKSQTPFPGSTDQRPHSLQQFRGTYQGVASTERASQCCEGSFRTSLSLNAMWCHSLDVTHSSARTQQSHASL